MRAGPFSLMTMLAITTFGSAFLQASIRPLVFSGPGPYFNADQATRDRVEKKLATTIIKQFENNGTLEQQLYILNQDTNALAVEPDPNAIRLLLRLYTPPATPKSPSEINPHLANVSLKEIVHLLARQWALQYRIEENAVVFFPIGETAADLDKYEENERKLYALHVEGVNYRKVDIEDALKDISEKSRKSDPQHIGLHFVLRVPPGSPPPNNRAWKLRREISLVLLPPDSDPLSLSDLMAYLTQQANLSIKIEKDDIALVPPEYGY